MTQHHVDARGQTCPVPLIRTKEVYDILTEGETMSVMVDNETSAGNIVSFIRESGGESETRRDGATITLSITKGRKNSGSVEPHCGASAAPHVALITSDRIGTGGEEELGLALMQSFLQTIKDVRPLPSHVIFLHRGVTLLENGRKTAQLVHDLETLNVTVLACGSCLDWYELKEKIACGRVSNMFDILTILSNAGHVVKP